MKFKCFIPLCHQAKCKLISSYFYIQIFVLFFVGDDSFARWDFYCEGLSGSVCWVKLVSDWRSVYTRHDLTCVSWTFWVSLFHFPLVDSKSPTSGVDSGVPTWLQTDAPGGFELFLFREVAKRVKLRGASACGNLPLLSDPQEVRSGPRSTVQTGLSARL